ncbi:HetP family heterocyst commitment protein [Planktothrix sp. FACHB-1365]|uniref:HetP family heterocyst commitment protein n=1 Tax=Planktothrix sp. FACHB-1365 TaxID=2692855 RepID=UPI001683E115|nr:HetP family heterocyst commitment protein [Planktothrix sp. FACHB-1365]MBD2483508.1 HetP family heterocyst commitment protein [Planktothrix sp. FACHB-1365]
MSAQYSYNNSKVAKTLSEEQFEQILDAILSGKYSWACVLILRFAGYNPLHYIPYRTYNRLAKDNNSNSQPPTNTVAVQSSLKTKTSANVTQIRDLTYLEPIPEMGDGVSGGCRNFDDSELFSTHWKMN